MILYQSQTIFMFSRHNSLSNDLHVSLYVTVLACVTRKVLGKEVLGHLDGVEQYYR